MARLLLDVPYLSQIDSDTDEGGRMCFSSTCAMALNYLNPNNSLFKTSGQKDDIYLNHLNSLGFDTTDSAAHVYILNKYGIVCSFITNGSWLEVNKQLKNGFPVPFGFLHKGPSWKPYGGGHWALIVGHNEDYSVYYVNDPYGELNLTTGEYKRGPGKMVKYSKTLLSKRWLIENDKSGWMIKINAVKK